MGEPMKEFRGTFTDVMVITELRGSYPNVPIASDVDYEGLIAGDTTPVFLTLPIGKAGVTSGNKRHYDDAFVTELMRQTLANKPVGLMGHLSETERATAFPPEAVHWVGALREGDTLWGKGYIPPGAVRDRIQRYKAQGKAIATSIDAFAEGIWDDKLGAHRMSAKSLRLNQIDIAPADRAGIPDLAAVPHLTTEMDAAGKDTQQEESTMNKEELIQELLNTKVTPQRGWTGKAASPSRSSDLNAIRETLGVDDKADLLQRVKELQERVIAQEQAAVKSRISELASQVKIEDVRTVVVEMVEGKQPQTIQEVEAAYNQVVEMQSIKNLMSATVQRTMGPRQTTPLQKQSGKSTYFNIPQEA